MKTKLFAFLFLLIITADAQQLVFPDIAADRITGMWFLKDKEELILINAAGSIYKSYDGGTTWTLKKNFPDVELTEIIFTDNLNGFISPAGLPRLALTVAQAFQPVSFCSTDFPVCDLL